MRELIAYFRSKVALQAELLESNKHRLALKFRIKEKNAEIDRLVKELGIALEDLNRERRLAANQNARMNALRRTSDSLLKRLEPFTRSPWGGVILDLPWHEHAEFLEAFFGKPKEEAYAEWKREKFMRENQIWDELKEASTSAVKGAGQPTGEGK